MDFIYIVFFVGSLGFMVASISGAPWVPARSYDIKDILDDAKISNGDVFLELGCGDGRLVRAAVERGAIATGYELNPIMWLLAWVLSIRTPNAHIRLANLWNIDLSKADVVLAFLVPRTMRRLEIKVEKEMKKGSLLISYIFPLPFRKNGKKHKSWHIYNF